MRAFVVSLVSVAFTVLTGACGGGGGSGTPDGAAPDSRDAPAPPVIGELAANTWQWIEVPGTTCGNGTPAGFGVNLSTVSDDLFVYVEGGGACWDANTCFTAKTAVHIEDTLTAASFDAELGHPGPVDHAASPLSFGRATAVFVPYCTGDIHAGTRVATYGAKEVHHTGATNMQAFVDALRTRFPAAHTLWIAGSSAGGFGATFNFHRFTSAWPTAAAHLLEDSSPFVPLLANYDAWRTQWNIAYPPSCPGCEASLPAVFDAVVAAHPTSRIGLLHYDNDAVVRVFFGYSTSLVPATDALLADHFGHPNTHAFVLAGDQHTMIGRASLVAPDGTRLDTWILQWADGDAAWRTVR